MPEHNFESYDDRAVAETERDVLADLTDEEAASVDWAMNEHNVDASKSSPR